MTVPNRMRHLRLQHLFAGEWARSLVDGPLARWRAVTAQAWLPIDPKPPDPVGSSVRGSPLRRASSYMPRG